VFDGHAAPAASPLARHAALAPDLAWDGQAPALPFTGADGELDVDRAREQFRTLGYRYSNDGALLGT
jgi:peptide/nickel transport system substrate-binding protein